MSGRGDFCHDSSPERAEQRWREAADAAGYVQPTEAEIVARWNERPELFDDLLRVLGGTRISTVSRERECEQEARRRIA